MSTAPQWLSTKEASEFLGVNLRTLYRFIDEGELPAYKFGRVIRLKQDDLEHFIDSARIEPGSLEHLYPEPGAPTRFVIDDLPLEGEEADCVFCAIVAGALPAETVWETPAVLAFRDLAPVAPIHVLVIPKEHIPDASSLDAEHGALLAEMFVVARSVAEADGVAANGYRLVFNVGDDALNTVGHLHLHVLGGRVFGWPPG